MTERGWLFRPEGHEDGIHHVIWNSEAERAAHELWLARPLTERTAVFRARVGLMHGDLKPLADLIRAGFSIDADIANDLAGAIEGPSPDGFCLKLLLAKGHKTPRKKAEIAERDFRIHWRVTDLRMKARGNGESGVSDAIFAQVADEFGVKVTTVRNAWRKHQI